MILNYKEFYARNHARFVNKNYYLSFTGQKIRDKLDIKLLENASNDLLHGTLLYFAKCSNMQENSANDELFNAAWNILLTYTNHYYNGTKLCNTLKNLVFNILIHAGINIRKDMHDIFCTVMG